MRSFVGSDKLGNVIWTAPSLILCGQYMHMKVGALTMLKFFGLSLAATIAFYQAFTPNPNAGKISLPVLRALMPGFSSHGPLHYMGADSIASAVIYFTLMYHRLFIPCLAFAAFDTLYYGPMCLGGPLAGIFAGLTIL